MIAESAARPRSMHREISLFAVLAFGISWTIWAPLWLPAFGVTGLPVVPFHHALGAYGPFLAAFLVPLILRDTAARRELWRGLTSFGPSPMPVFVAIAGPFILLAIGLAVAAATAGSVDLAAIGRSDEFPQFGAVTFLLYNILTFGLGEETGWRGFALPRLQFRFSAAAATGILFVIWAAWHIPLFAYRPGYTGMDVGGIAGWLVSLATGAVLTTVLYNVSKGSILVVALFHAAIDVAFTASGMSPLAVSVAGALIMVAGVAAVFTFGPANRSLTGRAVWPQQAAPTDA